jgi:SEC-C motif-containing protein
MSAQACPCTSGKKLAACCGPYLEGAEPPDAEAVMRSRFTAYALGRAEHLWRTLAPTHPDRAKPRETVLFSYRQSAAAARFRRLDVIDRRLASPPDESQVLFVARIFEKGRDVSFAELSTFVHDGSGWRYASGEARNLSEIQGDPLALRIDSFSASVSGAKSSP